MTTSLFRFSKNRCTPPRHICISTYVPGRGVTKYSSLALRVHKLGRGDRILLPRPKFEMDILDLFCDEELDYDREFPIARDPDYGADRLLISDPIIFPPTLYTPANNLSHCGVLRPKRRLRGVRSQQVPAGFIPIGLQQHPPYL